MGEHSRDYHDYVFRDGKLASNRDCWDYTSPMRQFGVLGASLRSLR